VKRFPTPSPFATLLFAALATLSTAPRAQAPGAAEAPSPGTGDRPLVLHGARIIPVVGEPIASGTIVIARGRIVSISDTPFSGENVDADVVDASGKWITPGLVDANTSLGLSENDLNEQGDEVTPHVSVLDAIDPADPAFARVRRGGVTTVQINPGNRNVFGGRGAVVKTAGATLDRMVVKDESGVRLTFGREPARGNTTFPGAGMTFRRPTTRMGMIWEARKAFYDAAEYRETASDGEPRQRDRALETLVRALDGELVVHSTARAEQDLRSALRLAEEFGYSTLIEEGTEAWRVLDELKAADSRVLFSSPSAEQLTGGGSGDGAEPRWSTLALLAEAGVPFAICTGADPTDLGLAQEATFAVRNGLDRATALAAITIEPARILGIEDRVGSLATGRDADVVIWSGDPFSPTSRVEAVYIEGRLVTQ
jgi:imidazolonepropionase-like amidohydrolase